MFLRLPLFDRPHWLSLLPLLAYLALTTGCGKGSPTPSRPAPAPSPPQAAVASHDEHEHDEHDHDHGHDEHAHDEHDHDEHDHEHAHDHEHPAFEPAKTIAEAIARVKALGADVQKALAAHEVDLADDLVHSVGRVIEDLHAKIAAADLDTKAREAATAAADSIFDAYEKLDTALHGAEEEIKKIDFAAYLPTLDSATKTLDDLFQTVEEAVTGEGKAEKASAAKPVAEAKEPAAE
jgi:hypothetical protein